MYIYVHVYDTKLYRHNPRDVRFALVYYTVMNSRYAVRPRVYAYDALLNPRLAEKGRR